MNSINPNLAGNPFPKPGSNGAALSQPADTSFTPATSPDTFNDAKAQGVNLEFANPMAPISRPTSPFIQRPDLSLNDFYDYRNHENASAHQNFIEQQEGPPSNINFANDSMLTIKTLPGQDVETSLVEIDGQKGMLLEIPSTSEEAQFKGTKDRYFVPNHQNKEIYIATEDASGKGVLIDKGQIMQGMRSKQGPVSASEIANGSLKPSAPPPLGGAPEISRPSGSPYVQRTDIDASNAMEFSSGNAFRLTASEGDYARVSGDKGSIVKTLEGQDAQATLAEINGERGLLLEVPAMDSNGKLTGDKDQLFFPNHDLPNTDAKEIQNLSVWVETSSGKTMKVTRDDMFEAMRENNGVANIRQIAEAKSREPGAKDVEQATQERINNMNLQESLRPTVLTMGPEQFDTAGFESQGSLQDEEGVLQYYVSKENNIARFYNTQTGDDLRLPYSQLPEGFKSAARANAPSDAIFTRQGF